MITPSGLEVTAASRMPTRHGEFRMESFRYRDDPQPHFALHTGLFRGMRAGLRPLVRIHSECVTGEIFGSRRCDCGEQLDEALRRIHAAGCGALIYLRQEGRGIGIENKLRAYTLQDQGLDTVDANLALDLPVDARDYAAAGAWLDHRKIRRCTLLTNNADKLHALQQYRIDAVRAPLRPLADAASLPYLAAKRERLGQDC